MKQEKREEWRNLNREMVCFGDEERNEFDGYPYFCGYCGKGIMDLVLCYNKKCCIEDLALARDRKQEKDKEAQAILEAKSIDLTCISFTVYDKIISRRQILDLILNIEMMLPYFRARDIPFDEKIWKNVIELRTEAINRILKRWKKFGLITYRAARWRMETGAIDKLKCSIGIK